MARDHAGQLVITRDLTLETNGVIIHDHKVGSFGSLAEYWSYLILIQL